MTIAPIAAIVTPALAAALAAVLPRHSRAIASSASFVSLLASAAALRLAAPAESLGAALMLLFSCLAVIAIFVLPKRDCTREIVPGMLFLVAATLLGYWTDNLAVLFAAWVATAAPFFLLPTWRTSKWRPRAGLFLSAVTLGAAIVLIAARTHSLSISALAGRSPGGLGVFTLLVIAVICRKGIFPLHVWVADAVDGGPAIPTALLLNGHFGALLVARVIVPSFAVTGDLFPVLSYLALATALYVAVRALAENSPRRLLAFIALSQSACILAGLESRTAEGVTGALVHWCVVTIATMGLFGILRLLEVRFGENLSASTYLGLAEHSPRLAVFFCVFALALVGLPGTLSFCSLDLLIHGTLASHPLTGLLLPLAIAMNAISIFRLFSRLFLGRRRTGFTTAADALPRERWTLSAAVLFVVLGGIFPGAIVGLGLGGHQPGLTSLSALSKLLFPH